jgi:hypothetical protein
MTFVKILIHINQQKQNTLIFKVKKGEKAVLYTATKC